MEAAVRETIRATLDERKRRRVDTGRDAGGTQGLAVLCWEAVGGDPLLALALALDRLAGLRRLREKG